MIRATPSPTESSISPIFGARNLLDSTEFLIATGLLALALLAGAVVVWLLDRWKKQSEMSLQREASDSLSNYRAMYDRGELSQEEYETVRERLTTQMREGIKMPEKPLSIESLKPTETPKPDTQKPPE